MNGLTFPRSVNCRGRIGCGLRASEVVMTN